MKTQCRNYVEIDFSKFSTLFGFVESNSDDVCKAEMINEVG